jgi:hypothetical protein
MFILQARASSVLARASFHRESSALEVLYPFGAEQCRSLAGNCIYLKLNLCINNLIEEPVLAFREHLQRVLARKLHEQVRAITIYCYHRTFIERVATRVSFQCASIDTDLSSLEREDNFLPMQREPRWLRFPQERRR